MAEDKKPNNFLGRDDMFDVFEEIFGPSVNLYRDIPEINCEGLQKMFLDSYHKYQIARTGMDERGLLGEEYQEPTIKDIEKTIKRARRDPEYRGLFLNPFNKIQDEEDGYIHLNRLAEDQENASHVDISPPEY